MSTALTRMLPGLAAALLTLVMIGVATWQHQSGPTPKQSHAAITSAELEAAVRLWNSGTSGRMQVQHSLQGTEARLMLVRALLEQTRAPDKDICKLLRAPGPREWCRSTLDRPHLYDLQKPTSAVRVRPAGGPVDVQLLASVELMNISPVGPPPTCDDHNEQRICAAESAITAGLASDPAGVRESCLHIEAGRWRDECVFMATERMYQSMGDRVLPQVAWLCAHAGGYSHHCLKRLINANEGAVPAADSEPTWEYIVGRATDLQTGIEKTDPILARQVVDWYYAEVMDLSYAKASVVQGRPLGRLPAEVHPHVRAAAIDRLVHSSPVAQRTLEEWIALVDHTMASHSPLVSPVSPLAAVTAVSDRWGYEEPTEANVRSIYWRGSARRMLSDDPASDRLVCLMETLARTNRSASQELEKLHGHPDEAVRLTATRLSYVVASNGN